MTSREGSADASPRTLCTDRVRAWLSRRCLLAALFAIAPSLAGAQTAPVSTEPGAWRFGASLYGYLPSLSGSSSAPADSNGTPIEISAEKIIDSLKFTAMGAF